MLVPCLSLDGVLADPDLAKRYGVLGTLLLQPSQSSALPAVIPVALLHHHSLALGPLALAQVEEVRPWLHSGIRKAFFTIPKDMPVNRVREELAPLPRDRVGAIVVVDAKEGARAYLAERVTQLCADASTIILQIEEGVVDGEESLVEMVKSVRQATKPSALFWGMMVKAPASMTWSATSISALHKMEIQALIPATTVAGNKISTTTTTNTGPTDLLNPLLPLGQSLVDGVDAFLACLRTDRSDGLFTTVVVDESNMALGLVYSSGESVRASVAEQRGIYYSRSRSSLWRKGDSSGAVQELVSLDMDCDSDALRFVVRQRGDPPAFCHLNRRNCWQRDRGLTALQRTLEERLKKATEGSYTRRLFQDPELLRHKLVEEAQELSEAVEPDDVAAEAADVFYFALVRCVAAGVGLEDVERHLDARMLKLARRPGNAKAYRIEAAKAILANESPPSASPS